MNQCLVSLRRMPTHRNHRQNVCRDMASVAMCRLSGNKTEGVGFHAGSVVGSRRYATSRASGPKAQTRRLMVRVDTNRAPKRGPATIWRGGSSKLFGATIQVESGRAAGRNEPRPQGPELAFCPRVHSHWQGRNLVLRKCPRCGGLNVRRSSDRASKTSSRQIHRSPYRCRDCGMRFTLTSRRVYYLAAGAGVVIIAGAVGLIVSSVDG